MQDRKRLSLDDVRIESVRVSCLDILFVVDFVKFGEQLHLVFVFLVDVHLVPLVSRSEFIILVHVIKLLLPLFTDMFSVPELHFNFRQVEVTLRSLFENFSGCNFVPDASCLRVWPGCLLSL